MLLHFRCGAAIKKSVVEEFDDMRSTFGGVRGQHKSNAQANDRCVMCLLCDVCLLLVFDIKNIYKCLINSTSDVSIWLSN